MTTAQVVIGVPGKWKDRKDLIQSIIRKSDGYVYAGFVMQHIPTKSMFQAIVHDHDPSDTEYTATVYVLADVSDFEGLKRTVDAVEGLLKAGGLAVIIESSNVSHTKQQWLELVSTYDYFPAYSHFVMLTGDTDCYFSYGMKSFGLSDVEIPSTIPVADASELLNHLNLYRMVEKPIMCDGHTFSMEPYPYLFRINGRVDLRNSEDSDLFNPFGVLALEII